jgi:hypothetical protein
MTTSNGDYTAEPPRRGSASIDELARRKHVRPIESTEDSVFDTDEELDVFLAHVNAPSRRSRLIARGSRCPRYGRLLPQARSRRIYRGSAIELPNPL